MEYETQKIFFINNFLTSTHVKVEPQISLSLDFSPLQSIA